MKPEPIRTLKARGTNGEAPPAKPRVVLPPDAPLAELVIPPSFHKDRETLRKRTVTSTERINKAIVERMAGGPRTTSPTTPKRPARPPVTQLPPAPVAPRYADAPMPGIDGLPEVIPVIRRPGDPEGTVYTREGWLLAATDRLAERFTAAGATIPPVRVSIGWPGGRGSKVGVIGQCWHGAAVDDHQPAIFISPGLKLPVDPKADGNHGILETLTHELVHAALGPIGSPHRGKFVTLAAKVGLVAPWTATKASPALRADLEALAAELGPFDHGLVTGSTLVGGGGPKVQPTRMLKVSCTECGYTLRTTSKWLAVAIPTCPNEACESYAEGEMLVEVK